MNAPVRPVNTPNDATRVAQENTVLSPRFYTTDFDELDRTECRARSRRVGRADRRDARRS